MNKTKWLIVVSVIFVIAYIINYVGCGGKGGSSGGSSVPKLTLTGKIGSGYQAYFNPPLRPFDRFLPSFMNYAYAYGTGTVVDKIIAIKCVMGSPQGMQDAKEVTISSADGSFNISLEKNTDWILMLVNSAAVGDAKFVGYVALNDGSGNNLLQFPVQNVSNSSLDLGNLDQSVTETDTALSDNSAITASTFAMNVNQLTALARNDDFFKFVKNFYFNYNYSTGIYWIMRPNFSWEGDYFTLTDTPTAPAYTYNSYQLLLSSNSTEYNMDNVCGTNGITKTIFALHPPLGSEVPKTDGTITYTYGTRPLSNTSIATYTVGADGRRQSGPNSDMGVGENTPPSPILAFQIGLLSGTIPAGLWSWVITNTGTGIGALQGQYDVAVGSPITGSGMVKGFVPVLKVNLDNDTNRRITSVDIMWFMLNATEDGYDLVTDISVLKYLMELASLGFCNYNNFTGPKVSELISFNPSTQTRFIPSKVWYYNKPGIGIEDAQEISWSYTSGGVGFFFGTRAY